MNRFALLVGLIFSVSGTTGWCVEIEQLSVVRNGKTFSTEAIFLVEAPQDAVVRAITAFDRLSDLNPAVLSSSAEVRENGEIRVTTLIRDCVALFCRTVALVEDVRFDADGSLQSQIVPELCDFVSGDATWRFDTVGTRTRVLYESRVRPNFWLPPLLGSGAFRRALRRQIKVAANIIETLANPDRSGDSYRTANTGRDSHQ